MTVEQFMEETENLYNSAHVGKIYDIVSRNLDESTTYRLAHPEKVSGYEDYINKYPLELAHLFPGGEVKAGIEDYDLRVAYQNRLRSINYHIGRRRVEEFRKKRKTLKRSMYLEQYDKRTYYFNDKVLEPFYLGYKIQRDAFGNGSKVYSIDTNQVLFSARSIYECIFRLPFVRRREIESAKMEFKMLYERGLVGDLESDASKCHSASKLSYPDRDYALATCEKPKAKTYDLCIRRVYSTYDLIVVEAGEAKQDHVVISSGLTYQRATQVSADLEDGIHIRKVLSGCHRDVEHYKNQLAQAKKDAKEMEKALQEWDEKADDVLLKAFESYEKTKKQATA